MNIPIVMDATNSGKDAVVRQRGGWGWGLVHGRQRYGSLFRVEGMLRVSGSPAWKGAEAGAEAAQQGAPPGVGAGWGGAGWHPGLGRGQGGWGWSCGWRAGGVAGYWPPQPWRRRRRQEEAWCARGFGRRLAEGPSRGQVHSWGG